MDEWDESTADDRVSCEWTTVLLDVLLRRGVSKETALKAAQESLAAAQSGNRWAKYDDYGLEEWIRRVKRGTK